MEKNKRNNVKRCVRKIAARYFLRNGELFLKIAKKSMSDEMREPADSQNIESQYCIHQGQFFGSTVSLIYSSLIHFRFLSRKGMLGDFTLVERR